MSYIFGIVDFTGSGKQAEELHKLEKAFLEDGFVSSMEFFENAAIGYSHRRDREPKCRIFKYQHLILVADIRIYNFHVLKSFFDFENEYEAFAKAFLHWGVQCGKHINGDFSVVTIDNRSGEVHLIRDHIGARPLTYCYSGGRLIFASHEYGIAKSGLCKTQLSEENLLQRFLQIRNDYMQTPFQDILRVLPGNVVSISRAGKNITTYWNPEEIKENPNISFDEAVLRLRELLIQAIEARIEPGKNGVHVSGGLDSTGVASILADRIDDKNRLTAYSWTPEELNDAGNEQNEKEYIDSFTAEKGVPVRYRKLEKNEMARDSVIPDFEMMHLEYPTIRMASNDQVKTLFSGWGGDEFLSLSTRGILNHFVFQYKLIPLIKFIHKSGIRAIIHRTRTEILPALFPFGLLPTYRGTDWTLLQLLKPSFIRRHWKLIFLNREKSIFGYGNRKTFVLNLIRLYHIPDRIDTWARYSERYGFEYKYPLLDKDVIEFWFSLPISFTYQDFHSRLLFREIMKGFLPENIRTRKDKSETLMIKYSRQNKYDGREYLKQLYKNIPENEHLPYFRQKALQKLFSDIPSVSKPACQKDYNKCCFYLRTVELVKRFLS
ncbi:MAG: hypothetical protein HQM10_26275 [Candidatus Riflebacteria bacterium]|nr:hypothetical protein [Candidatus Riflebacteria bacterium]